MCHAALTPLAVPLSQEGLVPDGCCCPPWGPPCALPDPPSLSTPGTSPPPPEHTQLLLGKALQKGQPRQQTARRLFLCLPALFTLSNTQPNSHIKLQKNQLGPLSHGINQKSCHIKKCYEISRGDKGKGKLKGSSCAGHLKT